MADPECPICNTKQSAFREAPPGQKRICSGCGSVERQRALWRLLGARAFGRLPFFGSRILVVAPSQSERRILAANGARKITSIDIRPELKPDIIANIMDMPQIPDGAYDIVVASFVLCMTKDHHRAISEFERVLGTDGFLMTSDPIRERPTVEFEGERIFSYYGEDALVQYQVGHFRHFCLEDLAAALGAKFHVDHQTMNDPVTGMPVTWFVSRKHKTNERVRMIPPRGKDDALPDTKLHVIPRRRRNEFIIVETAVPVVPTGITNLRFGDHAHGELLCYGHGVALVSHDLGKTWDIHDTPQTKDAQITTAFIGSDFYLQQSIGVEGGLTEPPQGWARIFAYDKEWRFLGSSRPALAHWHGSWSIDQHGDTIMWGTYHVNTDKYKLDYQTNPEKYANTVYPNSILRSRDRGLTWERVLDLSTSEIRHIHCVQHDPFAPGTWWAGSGDLPRESQIYRSTNDGDTWEDMTGEAVLTGPPSFRPFKQAAYRFTALAFSEQGLYWPTDDWLGQLQHYDMMLGQAERTGSRLFFSSRGGSKMDAKEIAYLGYAARSMTDVGKGWIVTTEAKYPEVSIQPQVFYVPKHAPDEAKHIFSIDNYAWRGTGFTYARASRHAENGVFFSFRQVSDGFSNNTKVMRWTVQID